MHINFTIKHVMYHINVCERCAQVKTELHGDPRNRKNCKKNSHWGCFFFFNKNKKSYFAVPHSILNRKYYIEGFTNQRGKSNACSSDKLTNIIY